jgi:hypothetical protein
MFASCQQYEVICLYELSLVTTQYISMEKIGSILWKYIFYQLKSSWYTKWEYILPFCLPT